MRISRDAALLTTVLFAVACSSRDSQPTAPQFTVAGQQVTAAPASLQFAGPSAATQAVIVTTNFAGAITGSVDNANTCAVSPGSQEVQVTPGNGGSKSARFDVRPVGGGACVITFTDKKGGRTSVTATVLQPTNCAVTLTRQSASIASGGGSSSFAVASTGCLWTAETNDAWINVTSNAQNVAYTVSPNTSALPRTGTINIHVLNGPSQQFTITQGGGFCIYTMHVNDAGAAMTTNGNSATWTSVGGIGTIDVTTNLSDCTWEGRSDSSWMLITAPSGVTTGAGTITYSIATLAHSLPNRSGRIELWVGTTNTLAGVSISQTH